MVEGLTEGRIVHFVPRARTAGEYNSTHNPESHMPAIVVRVWDKEIGSVNLQVFTDNSNDGFNENVVWRTCVVYSEEPKPYTWHFLERA